MGFERRQSQVERELSTSIPLDREFSAQSYRRIVDEIAMLDWSGLTREEVVNTAWTYYYFSVQFCETVGVARRLHPDDESLAELDAGERDTDNLSPCPGVVTAGERIDHDKFMWRTLQLEPIEPLRERRLKAAGAAYLEKVRAMDDASRVASLASYEDGGLERTFRAMLRAQHWDGPLLFAFHHFLEGHIALDSDPDHGHGALCRSFAPTPEVHGLWAAFKELLLAGAPSLSK